jgi:hypothetical protein
VLLHLLLGQPDELGAVGRLVAQTSGTQHRIGVLRAQVLKVLVRSLDKILAMKKYVTKKIVCVVMYLVLGVVHADAAGVHELRREALHLVGGRDQRLGQLLVAATAAGGHHSRRARRPVAELTQLLRSVQEIHIPVWCSCTRKYVGYFRHKSQLIVQIVIRLVCTIFTAPKSRENISPLLLVKFKDFIFICQVCIVRTKMGNSTF